MHIRNCNNKKITLYTIIKIYRSKIFLFIRNFIRNYLIIYNLTKY